MIVAMFLLIFSFCFLIIWVTVVLVRQFKIIRQLNEEIEICREEMRDIDNALRALEERLTTED